MRHVRTSPVVAAALLALAVCLPAAGEEAKKPSASMNSSVAQTNARVLVQTPFKVWPDGNWIFVVNYGTADWKGAVDVNATCTPVAPTTTCGSGFPAGKFHAHYATFPKGFGNAPIKGSGNAQQVNGPGWIAVMMGLPVGSYKITATAGNNTSPETNITIPGAPANNPVVMQPAVMPSMKPTKTP